MFCDSLIEVYVLPCIFFGRDGESARIRINWLEDGRSIGIQRSGTQIRVLLVLL
jgi:hypothetical protein